MRAMKARLQASALAVMVMALALESGVAAQAETSIETVPTHSFSGAYLAGRAAEFDNDLESAISYYERAIAFDPDNVELQQTLLLALVSRGRMEEALLYAEKLKSVPEAERFSRLVLAVDAFKKEDYAAAERWLRLALESDLDRLITGIMTTWAVTGREGPEAGLARLDGLEGPAWYDLFKSYHRALLLAQAGRGDEASEAFETLIGAFAGRPVTADTFGRIAEAYAALLSSRGDTEKAFEVLEKAEAAGGGVALVPELRRRLEAGEAIDPVVVTPSDGASEILLNVATELANTGGDSFVRLYLRYAQALDPDNDAVLVQLAHVAERQQEGETAIALYRQIDERSPRARFAGLQIGLNLADLERNDEAVEHLKQVLEDDPDDMRSYLALGGVYFAQKNYRAAADLYDTAIARIGDPKPEHWNIFYQRGIAYERLKEWPKAEPNFRKALELYPDHPQVLNYLGYSWVDMNMNLEEGMELIRRAVELRPSDGYIVDSLGWAYYRLGQYEEAVEHLERAVSLRPDDAILNDHLGDAYWRVGRRLEARYQWAHARDLDPEPEILAQVERKLEEGLPPGEDDRKLAEAAGAARNVMNDASNALPPEAAAPEADASPAAPETPGTAEADKDQPKPAQAEPKPEASAEPDAEIYTVKPGQTLWSIAVEELGDGERFREILELNPVLKRDPNRIRPGQELRLPR